MDSRLLKRLSEKAAGCFLGVFPSDKLPKNVPRPSCLIANTQPSGSSGEHWIAIFINKEGYGDYFCSFGKPPISVFSSFLNHHCTAWNYSNKTIQNYFSTTCGQYALFFLYCRACGLSLSKFLSLFTKNYEENDNIVTAFVNGKFNVNTLLFDHRLFQ
jgi:hypothetical protein